MYFTGACGETLFCTIGSTHIDKKKKKVCIGTLKKIAFNHAGNKFFTLFAYDGPSDPTTAAPKKKSVINTLCILSNFFSIHPKSPSFLELLKGSWVEDEERKPCLSSDRDSNIYRLAVPVLMLT